MLYTRDTLKIQRHIDAKCKRMKKIYDTNSNQEIWSVYTNIRQKIQIKVANGDKEGNFKRLKVTSSRRYHNYKHKCT
jgi:hypothetical protein